MPLYNGRIDVSIFYPLIVSTKGSRESNQDNALEVVDPEEITEQRVIGHVKDFLDKMTSWELSDCLDQAIQWEYVHRNAATGVKTKTPAREKPLCWNRVEATAFLEAVKEHRLYPL